MEIGLSNVKKTIGIGIRTKDYNLSTLKRTKCLMLFLN